METIKISKKVWEDAGKKKGWLNCDGSAVSRVAYTNLFNAIGTNFGVGDGSATFNLPDFRGVFAKGAGTTTRAAGKDGYTNAYAAVLGTYYTDKFQTHRHAPLVQLGYYEGGRTYNQWPGAGVGQVIGELTDSLIGDPKVAPNSTLRSGNLTEPQSLGVNYIIKYADVLATSLQTVVPLDGSVPMTGGLNTPSLQITGTDGLNMGSKNITNTVSIYFTNSTVMNCGILNGTNGVYWTIGTNEYWMLFR